METSPTIAQLNKKGFDDELADRVDFKLYNSDSTEARVYRDGVRAARRKKRDALEPTFDAIEDTILASKFEAEIEPSGDCNITITLPDADPLPVYTEEQKQKMNDAMHAANFERDPGSVLDEIPDDPAQLSLLDVAPDWKAKWAAMPEFNQQDLTPWQSVKINFAKHADRVAFARLIGQTITDDTRSLWHPKAEIGHFVDRHYTADEQVLPKYPIYVISKGRWESRLTIKSLEKIGVQYHVVIEPQEFPQYSAVVDSAKILVLPFSNLGLGSIPARNWVWEHSIGIGAERHWILDDNIDGFFRLHDNLKVPVSTGSTFRAAEDFVDRYTNVALAGFQYFMFAPRKAVMPPFTLNTRIYSCILIRNDLPHRWRGRYNEDTDLSIRVLKDGHCTVLFNAFLAFKMTTMTMTGGNTDELYKDDGRKKMAESLREQHPELVKIVWKWGRWQHHVHYRVFKDNRLVERPDYVPDAKANNYGMKLEFHADALATPPPVPIATPEPQPLPIPPAPITPAPTLIKVLEEFKAAGEAEIAKKKEQPKEESFSLDFT